MREDNINMADTEKRILPFARRASSVRHSDKVVRTISRTEIAKMNRGIELKIRQNERERTASMSAAARCVVGGK